MAVLGPASPIRLRTPQQDQPVPRTLWPLLLVRSEVGASSRRSTAPNSALTAVTSKAEENYVSATLQPALAATPTAINTTISDHPSCQGPSRYISRGPFVRMH